MPPNKTPIIAVVAQKGGCAKTTTAQAISQEWAEDRAHDKRRVMAIDLDPQGNLTELATGRDNPPQGAVEWLLGEADPWDLMMTNDQRHLDVMPAGESLIAGEYRIGPDGTGLLGRALSTLLTEHDEYGLVVIDTPPSLGILTVSALYAATHAVLVANPDRLSLTAIAKTADAVVTVGMETGLKATGAIITRADARLKADRAAMEAIQGECGDRGIPILGTITQSVAIRESQINREPLYRYCQAMLDYDHAYARLLEELQ